MSDLTVFQAKRAQQDEILEAGTSLEGLISGCVGQQVRHPGYKGALNPPPGTTKLLGYLCLGAFICCAIR